MPGLFRFNDLWNMDYRLLVYWYRQAVKASRKRMVEIAYGVNIGFSDGESFKRAIDALTLDPGDAERRKQDQVTSNWNALKSMGKG